MKIKLKDIDSILSRSIGFKLDYIRRTLSGAINERQRKGKYRKRTQEEIFRLLFNDFNDNPQGEFAELRHEIIEGNGRAAYIQDLADLLYNSLRFQHYGIMLPEVYGIGRELGFNKREIVDGCIIKYDSRARYGKQEKEERKALEKRFGPEKEPKPEQCLIVLKRIEDILLRADELKPRY